MRSLIWISLTYAVFVLQTALAPEIALRGIPPQFVLGALVLLLPRVSRNEGLWLAATWGMLSDCLTSGRVGPGIATCVLMAAIITRICPSAWMLTSTGSALLAIPLLALLEFGLEVVRLSLASKSVPWNQIAIGTLGTALYTAVLIAVGNAFLNWAKRATRRPGRSADSPVMNSWRMLTE
jgi:rod shape-determining protein MreD